MEKATTVPGEDNHAQDTNKSSHALKKFQKKLGRQKKIRNNSLNSSQTEIKVARAIKATRSTRCEYQGKETQQGGERERFGNTLVDLSGRGESRGKGKKKESECLSPGSFLGRLRGTCVTRKVNFGGRKKKGLGDFCALWGGVRGGKRGESTAI